MTPAEFERALAGLRRDGSDARADTLVRCTDCRSTTRSVSSQRLDACDRCRFCTDLSRCTDCSHCSESTNLHSCVHCHRSTDCTECRYVEHSTGCVGCTYCFGCVGLTRASFHIANVPYDRKTYFERVEALRAAGW